MVCCFKHRDVPTTLANINPFRYRGYYYDTETGLYCLNARYYDPSTCRFVNADSVDYIGPDDTNGYNLYTYYYNSPISYLDNTGTDAVLVTDYGLDYGLIILRYSRLYIQDANGVWYRTEYTGKYKSDAHIVLCKDNPFIEQTFWERLGSVFHLWGKESLYIKGDFSKSYEYASQVDGSDLGWI